MRGHHRLFLGVVSLLLLLKPAVARAESDLSRVLPPSSGTGDERLHPLHDVDHPWMFEAHYSDKSQWQRRTNELKERVLVSEGLWPEPVKSPLNAVIHGKIEREGYTIEKVFFASLPGHYVSGNLYRPTGKGGKLPAVLCPHGHWTNGRFYQTPEKDVQKQLEMGAEKTLESARFPIQARCAGLARMGCIVFMYDMIGYADSQAIVHRTGFTDVEATLRLQSFMGLQTWNSIRSLDFVCSLPDVDVNRIAATGASGGATQTLILGAIDPRVTVSFPAVMVSEAMQGGCICENSPLLRINTNNAEIASLFAPKPLGMTSANDWTRKLETKGFPQIRDIYKLYGAPDNVAAWYRPFPHNYNQVSRELMYNWLNRHLKLGQPEPVVEQPFVPVPPGELSVYDAEHPRPADSLDAAALRKAMTTASDEQMRALAREPGEYRKIVKTALAAMINDTLPAPDEILIASGKGPRVLADGLAFDKGVIRRKEGTSAVPYVAIVPPDWNGTVLLWISPDGKSSLFDGTGKLTAATRKILENHAAVVAPDLADLGELAGGPNTTRPVIVAKYAGYTYPGYYHGYNRSLVAQRASDVLSAIAWIQGWEGVKSIRLIAFGRAGVPALLAHALAGEVVERALIDLNHFDFNQVVDLNDEMFLPGSLKYGGLEGILPLCAGRGYLGVESCWSGSRTGRSHQASTLKRNPPTPI